MNAIASKYGLTAKAQAISFMMAALVTLMIVTRGMTVNQSLAIALTLVVLSIWLFNKVNGIISGLVLFVVKPVFVRAAFAVDFAATGTGGLDLLGMTPAVLLAAMVIWQIYLEVSSGQRLMQGRTRTLLTVLVALSLISIFNPASSIIVGLGGFERNILPNMMILFATAFLVRRSTDTPRLIKVLLVVGLVSCVYAVGQYWLGLYPWEKDWIRQVAFKDSMNGWLTIGLRGVEFRIFSVFYNYMDFTFSNVLICAIVQAFGRTWTGKWRLLRQLYFVFWVVVLILTLERMPMLMSAVGALVIYYFNSSQSRRRTVVWTAAIVASVAVIGLNVAGPYLKSTGADKLVRLAELANPFEAGSIQDRAERKWTPTLETIKANPLGVGIGYGSQTKANSIANKSDYWVEPHNEVLQKALETGLIGGLVYLLLLISVFRDSYRLAGRGGRLGRLGVGMMAATAGYWLCGMVNVPFSGASGILYWAVAGVVIGMLETNSVESKDSELREENKMILSHNTSKGVTA